MKANAVPLLALFEKKMRLEVPLFQRQYVWNLEQHWLPLWEDVSRKFVEAIEGRDDAPVHFLGAMVLDQKQTPATHVEKRQVIDGQQRLTTLQIFLAAFRDLCVLNDCKELAEELDAFILNKGMMADSSVDKFKVWPTQLDRAQFMDVVGLASRSAIEVKHPLVRKKYARVPDPRPRMVEAYLFFSDELREFFPGVGEEPPLAGDVPLDARIEKAFQALKTTLQVVAIDLDQGDDAQVIFETLNARGEPLLPADLLRNYIFLRAARSKESQEELYEKYWKTFDDAFWRLEVRQGRLVRPRSDLFMQHFLSSRQMVDIPIKHLFVEYKYWIERTRPFPSVEAELSSLSSQGQDFRRIIEPEKGHPSYGLVTFLEAFDVRTVYPLLLYFFDSKISSETWKDISTTLESYVLRRAVVGWTTKSYNKVFLALTKTLRSNGPTSANLGTALSALTGESSGWPSDEQFKNAWRVSNAYRDLNNARIVHILKRLNDASINKRNEELSIESPLTVEHLLPQSWLEEWFLPDGSKGLSIAELYDAADDDPRAKATLRRNAALQTLGNLTILTQALNSTASNSPWEAKRPELMKHSLLPINQSLHSYERWDEESIEKRSLDLFDLALKLWPGPSIEPARSVR